MTAVDTYRVQILPLNVGAADLIAASDLNEGIGFAAFVNLVRDEKKQGLLAETLRIVRTFQ